MSTLAAGDRGFVRAADRARESPALGLLSTVGWSAFGVFLVPVLLPPVPAYRTLFAGLGVVLFVLALVSRRSSFVLAVVVAATSGFSALAFGLPEPVAAAPIALAGYLAGSALREIYDVDRQRPPAPLLPVLRAWVVVCAVSAFSSWVAVRTGYLLLRDVPPPRTVNVLGEDVQQALAGTVAALAAVCVLAGLHRAATRLAVDVRGQRAVDTALVLAALASGGMALLQKLEVLPILRAERWAEWNRAQATFTDPSAAGVAGALLLAPLLARAAAGTAVTRILAGLGAGLSLLVVADAGSRAGLVGTLTSVALFLVWSVTRLAAGERPGVRRRVVATVGALVLLLAAVFGAALAWPSRGAERSALIARLTSPFQKEPTPSERKSNRLLLYEGALTLFQSRPVAGIGLGGFRTELPNVAKEVLLRPVRSTDFPPSLYLGALVETGLAGAAVLVLFLLGVFRGVGRALTLSDEQPETALRSAGAGAALIGLSVVFLFGSHLVYTEIAVLTGVLLARLPLNPDGRMSRLILTFLPVVLAGSLVLLSGGAVARFYETMGPAAAFARSESVGVFDVEREPDGRAFRWTSTSAAFRIGGPPPKDLFDRRTVPPSTLALPVKSARPDGTPVELAVYWNDALRGRVSVPKTWGRLELAIDGPGVLRLVPTASFRPLGRDRRRLGIEVGVAPEVVPLPTPGLK